MKDSANFVWKVKGANSFPAFRDRGKKCGYVPVDFPGPKSKA